MSFGSEEHTYPSGIVLKHSNPSQPSAALRLSLVDAETQNLITAPLNMIRSHVGAHCPTDLRGGRQEAQLAVCVSGTQEPGHHRT